MKEREKREENSYFLGSDEDAGIDQLHQYSRQTVDGSYDAAPIHPAATLSGLPFR